MTSQPPSTPSRLALPEIGGAAVQARPPARDLVGRLVLDRLRVELSLEPSLGATRAAYVLGQLGRDAVGEPADQVPVGRGEQLCRARVLARRVAVEVVGSAVGAGAAGGPRRGRRRPGARRRAVGAGAWGQRSWGVAPEGGRAGGPLRTLRGGQRLAVSRGLWGVVRHMTGGRPAAAGRPPSSSVVESSRGRNGQSTVLIRSVGVAPYGSCASRKRRSESMSSPPISLFVPGLEGGEVVAAVGQEVVGDDAVGRPVAQRDHRRAGVAVGVDQHVADEGVGVRPRGVGLVPGVAETRRPGGSCCRTPWPRCSRSTAR